MKSFNKNFYLIIIGQIVSLFGASILRFALSLYILDLTGSAIIFGWVIERFATNLPEVIIAVALITIAISINARREFRKPQSQPEQMIV